VAGRPGPGRASVSGLAPVARPPLVPVMEREPEIRLLRPDDDIEAELALRRRAFGPITAADQTEWVASLPAVIEAGQVLGVFDGRRLVASARYYPMRQWWHGRSVPMAGVAGVKVAPEQRGRGIGRALMTRLLTELADRGYLVSTLYASTNPLYRWFGWETAGGQYKTVLPAQALTALAAPDPDVFGLAAGVPEPAGLRPAGPADAATVVEVLGRAHQVLHDNGPTTREPSEVGCWLDDADQFAYLADDGFLSYHWADGHHEVAVDYLVAASAATAHGFWQILASHATMASRVRACLAPHDPVGWLLADPRVVTSQVEPWMLRVIDPATAIAARGFPGAAGVQVRLDLTDAARPANSGRWLLEISGGAGQLAPAPGAAGGGALRLGARGLAALFAGVPLMTLRLAGLVAGPDPADDALDAAFGGPAYMYDYF
jgi:predicted acetyltransferase